VADSRIIESGSVKIANIHSKTIIKSDSEVYNNFCKKGDRSTGYNLLILVVGLFDHYTIIIA